MAGSGVVTTRKRSSVTISARRAGNSAGSVSPQLARKRHAPSCRCDFCRPPDGG